MVGSNKAIEVSGVRVLTGTPDQVRDGLDHLHAERVVALALEDGNETEGRAILQFVFNVAPIVRTVVKSRLDESLRLIVEALVPNVPPPKHLLIEARMTAQARKAVLESGEWLTAAQIAEMAGFSASNPSAQPNKWKKDRQIFALHHRGADYFPGYALDPAIDYRPAKGLAKVLAVFEGRKSDWGLAYWFASVNSFLGGKRPQDLMIDKPEEVVAAANDEVAGVLHG